VNSAVQRYLDAASGLTELTRSKAEQIVKQLVKSGEAAGDQVGELVEDLIERQRQNREAISSLVKNETTRVVHTMGLVTSEEVERLQKQVADLKREVTRLEAGGASSPAAPAKKTAAKKTATKKATAKKTATKKATAKKATAKKTATKKTTATPPASDSPPASGS
jgi:polyhydroxyalkanoate synthesis regulator phasin